MPITLIELARQCQAVYDRCAAIDPNLFGHSLLDLCADNITNASLADIRSAIVVAGIEVNANDRIKKQIAAYR